MKRSILLAACIAAVTCGSIAGAAPTLGPVVAAHEWLNGRVTGADLSGKVVLVDVFTVECINCQHVTPNLRRLHAEVSASDFAIVGVHAPELPAEHVRANVVRELARQGIVWPVAIDDTLSIWKALDNEYWPTQYIFDRHGTLRRTVVGEGQDDAVDATVRMLVAEH